MPVGLGYAAAMPELLRSIARFVPVRHGSRPQICGGAAPGAEAGPARSCYASGRLSLAIRPRVAVGSRLTLLALLVGGAHVVARAEPESLAEANAVANNIIEAASETFDCRLSLLGKPRRDSFLGDWVVPYAAAGRECDGAQGVLSDDGAEAGIQFMRRPNLSQLRAMLGPMIRSAELASGCRIGLRGQPALDEETARWFVQVIGAGANCGEALRDLSRQAADIDATILGTPDRPLVDGGR